MNTIHQRPQVMYKLDIGSELEGFDKTHIAIRFVADSVSKVTGGCTLIDGDGYWADVERADKEHYNHVDIGCESNVQIQVKAEVQKEKCLEEVIVSAIIEAAHFWPELGINWVCGEKVTKDGVTVGFNFSVEENK